MMVVVSVSFFVLVVVGFGAKTSCTNDASVNGLDETPCAVIDTWAWGGLILTVTLAVLGYGVLVPKRIREWVLIAMMVVVLFAASAGMAAVHPG